MSAKIYQFPARGRAANVNRRDDTKADANVTPMNVAVTACGSAWYHEEAMREAELPRKN